MNLPTPCQQTASLLDHIFILVSWVRCPHKPTSKTEPGCEDYSFLDQVVGHFEHGPDSVLMDSVNMPELHASFDKADAMPSPVTSGFCAQLALFLTVQYCSLLLASNLINYSARLGPCLFTTGR